MPLKEDAIMCCDTKMEPLKFECYTSTNGACIFFTLIPSPRPIPYAVYEVIETVFGLLPYVTNMSSSHGNAVISLARFPTEMEWKEAIKQFLDKMRVRGFAVKSIRDEDVVLINNNGRLETASIPRPFPLGVVERLRETFRENCLEIVDMKADIKTKEEELEDYEAALIRSQDKLREFAQFLDLECSEPEHSFVEEAIETGALD